jgi:Methyltransferase FkbM domain
MSRIKRNILRAANSALLPFGVTLDRAYSSRAHLDQNFPMTRTLCSSGAFARDPLSLVDVGCAGGIDDCWRAFGLQLHAVGIDAMNEECARLRGREDNPHVKYISALLTASPGDPSSPVRPESVPPPGNPWGRLSTAMAVDLRRAQPRSREETLRDNEWTLQDLSNRQLSVEELISSEHINDLDFLKIDIDGPDYEVLVGFAPHLDRFPVLGVKAEVNFFGTAEDGTNTFHSTDRFLRRRGFELFALSTRKYSSAAIPAPFEYAALGPTTFGRVFQGDAVYFRDPAAKSGATDLDPAKLLKLSCMFELFGLPDCAAELLLRFNDRIGRKDLPELLDLLIPYVDGVRLSYEQHLARFRGDPRRFYRWPKKFLGIL